MCAWDLGFVWLALGRAATGLGGASLVIHTPSVALPHVPENWKKVASGVVFTGAGGSIMLVGLLVPFFLSHSVMWGWLFEATLALVAAVIAWPLANTAATQPNRNRARPEPLSRGVAGSLFLLGAAYFLAAIGITPHTLFLTDYLHRDLGVTAAQSSMLFSLIGVGSLLGSPHQQRNRPHTRHTAEPAGQLSAGGGGRGLGALHQECDGGVGLGLYNWIFPALLCGPFFSPHRRDRR